MRTFIAIELPPAIHSHLARVQQQLQSELQRAATPDCFNWVAPEKTHLTLRFLGETTTQQAQQIKGELARLVAQQQAFPLTLQTLGAFPHFRRTNVLWLGLSGAISVLERLQQQVETRVQQVGFPPEERRFTPHLTLARTQRQAPAAASGAAGRVIESSRLVVMPGSTDAPQFTVTQIVHMQSELRPEGARYTPLGQFALQDSAAKSR